jgi:hypothetical protein
MQILYFSTVINPPFSVEKPAPHVSCHLMNKLLIIGEKGARLVERLRSAGAGY